MKRTAAALALFAAVSDGARAELPKFEIPRLGIFRKKKEDPPAPPPQQPAAATAPVETAKPAKLTTLDVLKTDLDEKKRVAAAESLRAVDPRTQPDVIPSLTTSLQQDPSATVRAAVAETIGKLKPVSAEAGAVLETVVVADPSDGVRKAAQQALWDYHLAGYRSASSTGALPQTAEPPLAKPKSVTTPPKPHVPAVLTSKTPTAEVVATPPPAPPRPITTGIGKGAIYPQTIEPPLAKPRTPVALVKTDTKPAPPVVEAPPATVIPTPMPVEEKKVEPAIPVPVPTPSGVPVPPPAFVPTIPPPPSN